MPNIRPQELIILLVLLMIVAVFVVIVVWVATRVASRPKPGGGSGRYCTQCGEPVELGHRFCGACGVSITGPAQAKRTAS